MERRQLAKYDLPDVPGVYLFKQGRKVLYVGKASILRDRVRSYFDDDLIATRGPRIVDMITKATGMIYHTTPTVLEALVREAALIRKYCPYANVEGKDDKTFLYAVITGERIPRVLMERGSNLDFKAKKLEGQKLKALYGPFTSGAQLHEGLRLIRRIFPFFDTPKPVGYKGKHQQARVEFNTQIGQYPRAFDKKSYARSIRHVRMFLAGKTKELRRLLEKEMKEAAKEERFEEAGQMRRQLFALDHIQDVSLIRDENRYPQNVATTTSRGYRIEAYDTAHISGTNAVGVMAVVIDGIPVKKEYRSFRIRGFKKNDDIGSLKEILSRRLAHPEWPYPHVIVVDGGKAQKRAAERVLAEASVVIPVVAVVKDEKHRPREVLPAGRQASVHGVGISDVILANSEAHRFSLRLHQAARKRAARF